MTWQRGAEHVTRLIREGKLEHIQGLAADGSALLVSADNLIRSAEREVASNPEAAFVLAYDAARKSCTGLLAQQGIRTKSGGHHPATEEVVRSQFGGPFDAFGTMRRRRAEIEYPQTSGDDVTTQEASQTIAQTRTIYEAALLLQNQLSFFRP